MGTGDSTNGRDPLTQMILGAAIEVHRTLGPGLLESAYEACLCHELRMQRVAFRRQTKLPVTYKGLKLDCGYRIDLIVAKRVVVELKAIDKLAPIHDAQVITYLRLSGYAVGLLINFNVPRLMDGVKRLVHEYRPDAI